MKKTILYTYVNVPPVNPIKWPQLLTALYVLPIPYSRETLALGLVVAVLTMKALVILLGLIAASLQSGGRGLGIVLLGKQGRNWGATVGYHLFNSQE